MLSYQAKPELLPDSALERPFTRAEGGRSTGIGAVEPPSEIGSSALAQSHIVGHMFDDPLKDAHGPPNNQNNATCNFFAPKD